MGGLEYYVHCRPLVHCAHAYCDAGGLNISGDKVLALADDTSGFGAIVVVRAVAIGAKQIINQRFEDQMTNLSVERWQSAPTPLNTVLWRCLVEGDKDGTPGFWIGYASLFDAEPEVTWRWVPQLPSLTQPAPSSAFAAVRKFFSRLVDSTSAGFDWVVSDLRFGETTMAEATIEVHPQPWIFSWRLVEEQNEQRTVDC